jgi:predicted HicB family RNase H-like nuclease
MSDSPLLAVRVPPDLLATLKVCAAECGVTLSEYVRGLLAAGVAGDLHREVKP